METIKGVKPALEKVTFVEVEQKPPIPPLKNSLFREKEISIQIPIIEKKCMCHFVVEHTAQQLCPPHLEDE